MNIQINENPPFKVCPNRTCPIVLKRIQKAESRPGNEDLINNLNFLIMKKQLLTYGFLTLLICIISCSEETDDYSYSTNKEMEQSIMSRTNAGNSLNPYDSIGQLHNVILDAYFLENPNVQTIQDVSVEIDALYSVYSNSVNILSTNNLDVEDIEEILDDPEDSFEDILSESTLSNQARLSFEDFVNDLIAIQDEEFDSIYNVVTNYESEISINPLFTNEDKRVILMVSSIARYSIYYEKRRDDDDWEHSVGNMAAATKGALTGSSQAVRMALIAGICKSLGIYE